MNVYFIYRFLFCFIFMIYYFSNIAFVTSHKVFQCKCRSYSIPLFPLTLRIADFD